MSCDKPRTSEPRGSLCDTSPEAERIMIEIYRKMSAAQKLQQVSSLTRLVSDLALADIRQRYPQADEREVTLRLASRWLSADLMRKIYHWDPVLEGY
jgi:hypothetical protein